MRQWRQQTFQKWNEKHICGSLGSRSSSKPSLGFYIKTFISSELMNWNQVHFHHMCYTFSWCTPLPCSPRDSPCIFSYVTPTQHTHTYTHCLCWVLSLVCSVGLEGPAALSRGVWVESEWVSACGLWAFGLCPLPLHFSSHCRLLWIHIT